MQIFIRLTLFSIIFSIIFWIIRFFNIASNELLRENLPGISWLFSTIVFIFSIVSGFVIQTQWSRWDRLETSVQGEVNSIWELLLFSDQLPLKIGKEIKKSIKDYLMAITHEGWSQMDKGVPSEKEERSLRSLQRKLFVLLKKAPEDSQMASSIFLGILDNRNERLHHSTGHLPFLLYVLIIVATAMVSLLSLFIAVPNVWLNYIFILSIGILSFLIFNVIEDLNHPFRPGTWRISKKLYQDLLKKIE